MMGDRRREPAARFAGVAKRYAKQPVLADFDLAVSVGESFGLVGVNGAGKTTCIKALLDFCEIQAGRIEIFGVDATRSRARARLAYLPERFQPPYYLRGRDFLSYMGRLYGRLPSGAETLATLAALDLDPQALDKPVRAYSKGMAQKLGLAACLLSQRELAVLDEPLSGLDPKARLLVKRQLQAWREAGRTLFFSTHLLGDVAQLCDRVGVLHEGRLRFVGSPRALCERYQDDDLEQAYLACIESP